MNAAHVVASLRERGKRLAGRYAKRRNGWFYVSTRTALELLERRAPRRPPPTGLESITVEALPDRVPGATFRELEPATAPVTPPTDWVWPSTFPTAGARRYWNVTHRSARGVVEIPGGVLFGSKGYFGPDPEAVLADASSLWNGEATVLAGADAALAVGLEELDGVTMSLWAGNAGLNYAHCLLQSVPRLDLLRRGFALDADRYLLPDGAARPTLEALDILGVPVEQRQLVPRERAPAYRCETLRAATSPPFAAAWPTAFLRELFLPEPPTTAPSRRIYIRREGIRRAVLNEDAVIELLESAGFEILSMDGPTVREQAATFADAEVIVSVHSACLANLVFASPGATVIELMGRNSASIVYAHLAWRHHLRYEMVMGTEPAPPDRWWTWQWLADTTADVPALRRTLERHDLA